MRQNSSSCMKIPWGDVAQLLVLLVSSSMIQCQGQEFDEFGDPKKDGASFFGSGDNSGGDFGSDEPSVPKELDSCDGIYVTYNFISREKTYPHMKNVSAQSWAFRSQLQVMNMGNTELKSWKVFVGFQYDEVLVSVDGGILVDGDELPAQVGDNGTTIGGYPQSDLKTAIETAGDMTQMTASVNLKGTQFGLKTGTPMPKTIKLVNDGFKCPGGDGFPKRVLFNGEECALPKVIPTKSRAPRSTQLMSMVSFVMILIVTMVLIMERRL